MASEVSPVNSEMVSTAIHSLGNFWFPVAGPLSYTKSAIFVYGPGLIGLSYTVEAIFVYESMLFGLSYTKKAIFVHGNRERSYSMRYTFSPPAPP